MPIYEYKCNKCGSKFEVMESFSANSVKECTACGCEAVRVMSAPSFQLKGGGWFKEGYSGKSNSCAVKNDACASCPNSTADK